MKISIKLGALLLIAGLLIVVGVFAVRVVPWFLSTSDINAVLKLAIASCVIGMVVLVVSVLIERLRGQRRNPRIEETEY